MNIFKRIERWLFGPEPEMDPVLAAIMRLPRPSRPAGPTGPRAVLIGPTGAYPYGPMTGAVVVVDDTHDCLTVAAAAAVAAMMTESTPTCPGCGTEIPPPPSTDVPLEAPAPDHSQSAYDSQSSAAYDSFCGGGDQ
jgi:hypothetical protein